MRYVLLLLLAAGSLAGQERSDWGIELWEHEARERTRIEPDEAKVAVAARSPETLWAFLTDPNTSYDDRMLAAEKARNVLPPRYIPMVVRAQLARQWESSAAPAVEPWTIFQLRRMPWQWQVERALARVEIPSGDVRGYDLVRNLPCKVQLDEWVIRDTLKRFPMTAESYGVFRNMLLPRKEFFISEQLPEWWGYRPHDDWHAAQAFIVAVAPMESEGVMTSELIATVDRRVFSLLRMIEDMADAGRDFPATAFLALADRIAAAEDSWSVAYDASRLVQVLAVPLIGREPHFQGAEDVAKWVARFRQWLSAHHGELEGMATMEAGRVAEARKRMNAVTLCRP